MALTSEEPLTLKNSWREFKTNASVTANVEQTTAHFQLHAEYPYQSFLFMCCHTSSILVTGLRQASITNIFIRSLPSPTVSIPKYLVKTASAEQFICQVAVIKMSSHLEFV